MHNPTRRSRKIGQTQGGRVKDGIAHEKSSRAFPQTLWRQLSEATGKGFVILEENPSRDYYHPCSPDQIRAVLRRLPARQYRDLRAIILRRLPRKDLERGVEARLRVGCIILNPFPVSNEYDWGSTPPPDSARRHYAARWDRWELRNSRWIQVWTPAQVTRYYLYHLLLHELGHINQPDFHSRRRRESFAEDYALRWARKDDRNVVEAPERRPAFSKRIEASAAI